MKSKCIIVVAIALLLGACGSRSTSSDCPECRMLESGNYPRNPGIPNPFASAVSNMPRSTYVPRAPTTYVQPARSTSSSNTSRCPGATVAHDANCRPLR